jgi:thymidine kinase
MNQSTHYEMTGRIELIIGCMYSGKTTELIRRANRYKTLGKKMMIFTHSLDTRYVENGIATHNRETMDAIPLNKLISIENSEDFKAAEIIFIEEGQFFTDLYDFTVKCADTYKKTVIVSGLDGDYLRKPFQQIVDLIPHAEHVLKLNALCKECGDGTVASFSKRIVQSSDRELVGSEGMYVALCRKHYNWIE